MPHKNEAEHVRTALLSLLLRQHAIYVHARLGIFYSLTQFAVFFDARESALGSVLVTLLLAVSTSRATWYALYAHLRAEQGGVGLRIAALLLCKLELVLVFLTPLYEAALEVVLALSHLINIYIVLEHFLLNKALAIAVAPVKIDGTHEGLKSVASHEAVVCCGHHARVSDESVKPYLTCQFVERIAAHQFASQVCEKAFLLVLEVFVKDIRYNRSEHSVAKILQTLVADELTSVGHCPVRVAFCHRQLSFPSLIGIIALALHILVSVPLHLQFAVGCRLVHQRMPVQTYVTRVEAHNLLYLQKRLLFRYEKKPNVI